MDKFKHNLDFLIRLNNEVLGGLFSIERNNQSEFKKSKPEKATNSELRRWFQNSAVHINGKAAKWDDPVPEVIESFVLFPKSDERRITLW